MYNKSKSSISFKEFKKKINENNTFENDWGFYIDTDNNNKVLKNISISYNNNKINTNNFCSKYSTIISIVLFSVIIIIII